MKGLKTWVWSITPSFCFLTSEVTTIWSRDRWTAQKLKILNHGWAFASNGKYEISSSHAFPSGYIPGF